MNQQSNNPPPQRRQLANWITEYASAANKISESPYNYNIWAAISTVSAVLKNNVWIRRGPYKILPNQYVVLVGPPGIGKGVAIHSVHDFARKPPSNNALANYIMDRITAPKLSEKLSVGFPRVSVNGSGNLVGVTDSTCILHASELGSLINNSDWMSTFLCDMWDRVEYTHSTKTQGTSAINSMCVSLIGACVPDFIHAMNKNGNNATNNGFTARTIFVYSEKRSQRLVWPKELDPVLVAKLQNDLQMISRLYGEFSWEPAAQLIFEQEYQNIVTNESDTNVLKDFKARQPVHLLKTAMALTAAGSENLVITQWAMQTAKKFIDGVLHTLDSCFRGIGKSILAEATGRIYNYIEHKKLCSKQDIQRDNWRDVGPEDLEKVLFTLISCGYIMEVQSGRNKLYKFIGRTSSTP
jgi:hypothetical protein